MTTLPRVLILGDSIAGSYVGEVAILLRGRAEVETQRGNGMGSGYACIMLDSWLGTQRWDVIHFNFGVWDLKIDAAGAPVVPTMEYENNLIKIVNRLRQTGARLIWASTVPLPDDPARFGDETVYNACAARIMRSYDIPIQDLHGQILAVEDRARSPGDDVHFNEEGRKLAGAVVAAAITAELDRLAGPATKAP